MSTTENQPDAKALKMFIQAERFCESGLVLHHHIAETREVNTFFHATQVLDSFALELYFKTLALLDFGSYPKSHDLDILFASLRPETQEAIRQRYQKEFDASEILLKEIAPEGFKRQSLEEELSQSKSAFVRMRYIFDEGIADKSVFLCHGVRRCTREVIFELKPDWPRRFRIK